MNSHATANFWSCFSRLPKNVQSLAKSSYALWSADPRHPSLHFKPLTSAGEGVWSVRIGLSWRALGVRDGNDMIWFWIGSHAEYDKIVG
jgi:hypothetical protein